MTIITDRKGISPIYKLIFFKALSLQLNLQFQFGCKDTKTTILNIKFLI